MRLWDDEIEAMAGQIRTEAAGLLALYAASQPARGEGAPVIDVEVQRKALAAMNVPSADAVDRTIAGPAGPIRVRTFVPDAVDAVLLHIHGGGFFLGEPEMGDELNSMLSRSLNLAVVSVDYRLAPEHTYPAGVDDCEAAAVWLLEQAKNEFGAERLLIGGESAGGHLAAATLLRVRDRHQAIDRFKGANLVFGVYDVTRTPSQRGVGAGADLLSAESIAGMCQMFTPGMSDEDRRDPDVSPLYADLTGMPPALFSVGTADHLLDDTLFMSARWAAAGNEAELLVYPGGPHGCTGLPTVKAHWTPRLLDFFTRCLA